MGKEILAVAIKPETAIPAELYYSESEYDEGVRQDGTAERITDISGAAGKYVCLRRHINSSFLRGIEPVVLVDMPGFDSPLDAHSRAIFSYLERGAHYAVLIAADGGTVSKSIERQISNILSFGKTCSFFLSRTDLRSAEETEEVRSGLQCELSALTGEQVSLRCVSRNSASLFGDFVHSLDAEGLFRRQFRESVLDECYDTKNSLNTAIAALRSDTEKNSKAVGELEDAIERIGKKKQKLIERARRNSFSDEADTVSAEIGHSLNAELDSLVSTAMSGGGAALQEEICSIVQSAVVSKAQDVMGKISSKLGKELSREIEGLGSTLSGYGGDGILVRIQQSAQSVFDSARTSVDAFIKKRQDTTGSSMLYKTLTGVFAATTGILSPLTEVLIIFLPDILGSIFGSFRKSSQEGQIREFIAGQIPVLKRSVRGRVIEALQENGNSAVSAVCEKFDEELQKKKTEIELARQAAESDSAAASARIETLSRGISQTDGLIEEIVNVEK